MTSFSSLDTALRSLRSQQTLIDIASHNIANANTPGFSRQVGTLGTTNPYPTAALNASGSPGQIGTGVEVKNIGRMRDTFTDYQLRGELAGQGSALARRDILSQIESIYNEPSSTGLSAVFGKYWQAWQEVANTPSDLAVRANLIQQGEAVGDTFARTYEQLDQLQRDVNRQVKLTVEDINQLTHQIAAVNVQITSVETSGLRANDLRDQRDLLMDKLSTLTRVSYSENQDGSLNVYVGSRQLVDRTTVHDLAAIYEPNQPFATVVWAEGNQPAILADGKLKGLITMRDDTLQTRINELNDFAARLIEQMNSTHAGGVGLGGTPGGAFFTGTDASNLRVNSDLVDDPSKIAASRLYFDAASGNYTYADGDASNAVAISQLQQALVQRSPTFPATILPGTTMTTAGAVGLTVTGLDVSKAASASTYVLSTAGSVVSISRNGAPAVAMTAELNPDGKTFTLSNATLGIRITISAAAAETMAGVAPTLNGLTFATATSSTTLGDQYAAQIAALGVASQAARGDATNQEVLVNHLNRRREEVSGVSLDEEATNLLKFQHAYEAAARVMTVIDEMLDKLINGTGVAGR